MTKTQELLKQKYNRENWIEFLYKTFYNIESTKKTLIGLNTNIVEKAVELGEIELTEKNKIKVFEVTLAKGIVLERNRVGIRNIMKKYWKYIDGAFIVYHRPENNNWRFTYVADLTEYNEEGEYEEKYTDPKRYTYIFGEGESCKTAAERFQILKEKRENTTIEDIKDAFSVEKLSKTFFKEYKEHYEKFVEHIINKNNKNKNNQFISIFSKKDKEVRNFCKKLLGRIVFIYFIQKKGWIAVPENKQWGQGDKNFLKNIFENSENKKSFYANYLSKLFFDTLNKKRENDITDIIPNQKIKIPFLNGGLFEEENSIYREINFEKELFKNLFQFFDKYNFTIYEDDQDDHSVAVDPEMLGHIFENLLEDNKDKGAYYTPKEIVHYMCQESLIEYLTTYFKNKGYEITGYTSLNNPDEPQMFQINKGRIGQQVLEIQNKTNKNKIDRRLIERLLKKKINDKDTKLIIEHQKELNNALDKVKICDPAIGSGAFPMGLLKEITNVRQTIHNITNKNIKEFNTAEVKLNIIQNSIYGVDIEKGAVDIAKLRFWLSLVVDENEPKPLPNLDYKILTGNSLIPKFNDEIIEIDWEAKGGTMESVYTQKKEEGKKEILKKIIKKQKEFFNSDKNKKKLATDIRNLKIDLIITQIELMIITKGQDKQSLTTIKKKNIVKQTERIIETKGWRNKIKELEKLKNNKNEKLNYFDWQLDFPEVMNKKITKKIGFDIVIGNPPYIDSETMVNTGNKKIRLFLSDNLPFCKGNWDIYIAFFNIGFDLLNEIGNLVFITPDKWLSKPFGNAIRSKLKNNFCSIAESGRNVFENAKVDSIITFITKKHKSNIEINKFSNGKVLNFSSINKSSIIDPFAMDWMFSDFVDKLNMLDKLPNKLSKYIECENACSTSDAYKIKDYLLDNNNKSFDSDKHLKIINTGTVGKYISKWGKREMTYLKNKYFEPIVNKMIFKENFSNSYGMKSILPKLIIKGLTLLDVCIDKEGLVIPGKSTLVITKPIGKEDELLFPLALINSKISLFYIKEKYRGSSYNQGINFNPNMINNLPVPFISKDTMQLIIEITKKIINLKKLGNNTSALEQQLNNLFYRLYNLSYEEVLLIDSSFRLSERDYNLLDF